MPSYVPHNCSCTRLIIVHRNCVLQRSPKLGLKVHTAMSRDVGILKIFPGITSTAVSPYLPLPILPSCLSKGSPYFQLGAFLRHPMRGVVLQTFGAGNMPSVESLLKELKDACDRGMVVVNCTQCASGNVTNNYPAARVSRENCMCVCV